jgi:glycopeptide antibiotics resistance protein
MNTTLKKILVITPVIIISLFYLRIIYHEHYLNSTSKRVVAFVLSVLLLYLWMLFITIRQRQDNFLQVFIQSGFFIYVFAVLQLTGYFILFREISSVDWWGKMNHRLATNDHVNFKVFDTMNRYSVFSMQMVGNAVMLLPLGIFIPLLNRKRRKFSGILIVLLISLLVSVGIEILQLATNYRSTDVDDVILNTLGACTGFLLYQLIKSLMSIDNSGKASY